MRNLQEKHVIRVVCMILLAMLLTACGKTNVSDAGGEGIIFDQEDRLPAMIAKDADSYYVLTNQHDDTHYKLMTGNDLHQLVEQYHTDGVTIRHLYASDGYAGWVEEDEKEYRYNVYENGMEGGESGKIRCFTEYTDGYVQKLSLLFTK